ncbi:type IV secretion system protein [Paraburkholderia mimosarum]|uniref:type IV secretion system protein n=1 Tax=Paraburkholderia mimosarum TaxID=312026 RepID=UPI0004132973|nr:type IV secretion system protein [Paraburkholderia mimosarum]
MNARRNWVAVLAFCLTLFVSMGARADDTPAEGQQITPPSDTTVTVTSKGNDTFASTIKKGEIAQGNALAMGKLTDMFSAVIPAAVTASQSVKPEADKFAAGLGVITLVLTWVRFSATRDPVNAWVVVFEELATLGIFASIYVGYQSFAPGFYGWFQTLAGMIQSGAGGGFLSAIGGIAGSAFESVVEAYKGTHWYEYIALTISLIPLILAYLILMLTGVVFTFMNNLGLIQAAVGIVMGQIAIALGFSSYTRGYFRTWLDYMISAGMYCVVSAILTRLVIGSLSTALTTATAKGLTTGEGGVYVFDLSLFVFLLSFEIPKFAAMFGGGANASGSMMKKVGSVATGGIL